MTEQQRKGIEILNKLRFNTEVWPSVVSEDDYYFLLDFIINKQIEISVPTPYPVSMGIASDLPNYDDDVM